MLALLAAVGKATCEERLAAAYRLLLWQAGRSLLPRPLAVAYVRLLKVRCSWVRCVYSMGGIQVTIQGRSRACPCQ